MAITIIHGANGGYKSSSVVQERIIPALIEGRTVVTNIRGVSLEKFYDSGFDVHPDSNIIYVDTDNNKLGKKGRMLMASYWHWVPLGALICFDESGVIFPKAWRDSDIKKIDTFLSLNLDHPIFQEYTIEECERPDSFVESFEMHRHYNWDIVLSAPNIKSIRDDIRNTSELAWRHRNAALVGLKGRFKAVSHDPVNAGISASQVIETRIGKIKKETFNCYESTKTGTTTDTANGIKSIFGSPRLLLALACSTFGFIYAFSSGGYDALSGKATPKNASIPLDSSSQEIPVNVSNTVPISQSNNSHVLIMGYEMEDLRIIGRFGSYYAFRAYDRNGLEYDLTHSEIEESGYLMVPKSDCHMIIVSSTGPRSVYCSLKPNDLDIADYSEDDSFPG